MSTIGEELGNAEERADKWYKRLENRPFIIFLGLSLSLNIWSIVATYRKDKDHRQDLRDKDFIIQAKDAEIRMSRKEQDFALQREAMAKDKLLYYYERGGRAYPMDTAQH